MSPSRNWDFGTPFEGGIWITKTQTDVDERDQARRYVIRQALRITPDDPVPPARLVLDALGLRDQP